MTKNARVNGEPLGERIVVAGRVLDEDGKPLPNTLLEVWQANAAGRYIHKNDQHDAPLDPNFRGSGRCVTDERRPLQVLFGQAGRVPVGQPSQRLAAEPYSFLAVRPQLHHPPGHPDVFPGRSAAGPGPDLQGARRKVGAN